MSEHGLDGRQSTEELPQNVVKKLSFRGRNLHHGWHKFAKDVGIVVLGVLLALGAEEVAQKIDNAQKVHETRAIAIRELEVGFGEALLRLNAQTCTLNRINEVSALLATRPEDFVSPRWIGRPPFADFRSSGWDAAAQAGRTALLDEAERTRLGGAFAALHRLDTLEQDEQKIWAALRQLEDVTRLDPLLLANVRSSLQQARLLAWQAKTTIVQGMEIAKEAGIQPLPSRSILSSTCLPMRTPRDEAIARMNAAWGDKLGEP